MTHIKFLTVFSIAALFMGCTSKTKNSTEESANAITLESIQLTSLTGEAIDMDEFKNKTVFINFWATWCKPCIQEMPTIEKAQEQLRGKNVVFLLASNESIDQIENFKNKRKFQFRFVRVKNLEAQNIQALPTTYIFDEKGKLVFAEAGFRVWDTPENINLITKGTEL